MQAIVIRIVVLSIMKDKERAEKPQVGAAG